ncbi:MAG: L,D-transpeptidase family protein [Bacteroidia bacterium]|jgi:murein L,D-transpeptidase YafK|nr:L,D-transpeptidase family protein [Bacteroidia bacterium]
MKKVKQILKYTSVLLLVCMIAAAVYYFFPEKKLPQGIVIDRLEVYKSRHEMKAFSGNRLVKTYTVAIGRNTTGDKQYEGDKRTPEGRYTINDRNPNSSHYKNLGISYPNDKDRAEARKKGKSPGGDVKIHGLKNGRGYIGKFHRWMDWTAGCIAVTNQEMEELYVAVKTGAVIEIFP